jgi:hypothetical protein
LKLILRSLQDENGNEVVVVLGGKDDSSVTMEIWNPGEDGVT